MTLNTQELSRWINGRHLEEAALQRCRQAFQDHPARLLTLPDFLTPSAADRIARFLNEEAAYRPTFGLYSAEDHVVSREQWLTAEERDRFYTYGLLDSVPAEFQASFNFITYIRLRDALATPPFQAFFQAVTGLQLGPLIESDVHATGAGDYLRAHSDNDGQRLLTFVLYLSPEWQPAFSGSLQLFYGEDVVQVEPAYNSIVLFDVNAHDYHVVQPVKESAGARKRVSLGGWYPKAG